MRGLLAELVAQSRKEEGCLHYELFQRDDAAHVFQTVERWRDQAAVDAHMKSAHVAAAIAQGTPHFGAAPEIQAFNLVV
jgi:quinol monooxygenase YgiN